MKKRLHFISATVLCLALCGCAHGGHGHDHDHEGHEHGHAEGHHHDDEEAEEHHHADGEIVLEPEMADHFGVKVDTVRSGLYRESIKAAGTFLSSNSSMAAVSAPVAGTVNYPAGITVGAKVNKGATVANVKAGSVEGGNTNAAAKAAMDAAKREVDRLKPLYDDRLVTATEYNAALAAYEQAKAAYSPAASGSVHSPISGVITAVNVPAGGYAEAGAVLVEISAGGDLTLRADVPQHRASAATSATDANLLLPDGRNLRLSDIGGRRISAAESGATVATGFVPVYFIVPASAGIHPGSTAEVYLIGEAASSGITVPRSALSEQQGSFYIYEKIGDHAYRRVPVSVQQGDGFNCVITSGLHGGEVIVTESVTTVRLAENSGAIPEGHTHSH